MTNLEYLIKPENIKELAANLIQDVTKQTYDYDWEENLIPIGEDRYYVCSDNEEFDVYEYDEAVLHEIEWLMTERTCDENIKED